MKLILTRKSSNPTCTLGELVSEDGQLHLLTKEGKIPKDRQGYIMWCLPPGEYKMEILYCAISYKDKPIRAYWPSFKRVPWFPRAGFYTGTMVNANKGRIKLGTGRVDDYTIDGDTEACQQMVRWAKGIYDAWKAECVSCDASQDRTTTDGKTPTDGQTATEGCVLTLEILQPEDEMEFSDISEHDFRVAEQIAKEKAEQEQLSNDLYGTE